MTPTAHPPANERIVELDAVRGLAAVGVLVFHLPRGFWFGSSGVDLFFVLSGYLITSIILKHHAQPGFLTTFYFRRALRIFPIYYLTVAGVVLLNALRKTPGSTDGLWQYLLYLQNAQYYWGGAPPGEGLSPLEHTWTLAVEEQFYLLWPAAVVILKPRRALWVCLALVGLPVALRLAGLKLITLFGHTDGLALGAGLAYLGRHYRRALTPKALPAYATVGVLAFAGYFALAAFVPAKPTDPTQAAVQAAAPLAMISLAYTAVVAGVLCVAGSRPAAVLRFRPLVWVGSISYGLYLYHWIIYEWLDTLIKFRYGWNDPWWLDVLKVALTFAAAAASWRLIERPLLRFKDTLNYRKRPEPAPVVRDVHSPVALPVGELS